MAALRDDRIAGAGLEVTDPEPLPPDHPLWTMDNVIIAPHYGGSQPGYEQREFPEEERRGRLRLVASRDGSDGSVTIRQDVKLYTALLAAGEEVSYQPGGGRHAWMQVIKGEVSLNGVPLKAGDGAAISEEQDLSIKATDDAEFLLFDLT